MNLPNPIIRCHYRNGFIKQYVRDHLILRTEAAGNNVTDYGVNKAIEHLPALRDKLSAINNNYLNIQQDILEIRHTVEGGVCLPREPVAAPG
jgi:hypothetical protein